MKQKLPYISTIISAVQILFILTGSLFMLGSCQQKKQNKYDPEKKMRIVATTGMIMVEVYSPALFLKNPTPSIFESLSMINGVQPQLNCNVCNTGDIHINGIFFLKTRYWNLKIHLEKTSIRVITMLQYKA